MSGFQAARSIGALLGASALALGSGAAGAAEAPGSSSARVTAVAGQASAGDSALEQRAELGEDQRITTSDDGSCAVLIDENALLEMCGGTAAELDRDDRGRRVLRVDSGEARIMVEPLGVGQRIEIHTPAAIATILGTVAYVTVDPVTGETTITSGDHDIAVRSRFARVTGSTVIRGGESTTIATGEAPQPKRRLAPGALASLGGCLMDLHQAAVRYASFANQTRVTDKVAELDMNAAVLPPVGPPGPEAALEGVAEEAPTGEEGLLDPIDGQNVSDLIESGSPVELPGCELLPCEHGQF